MSVLIGPPPRARQAVYANTGLDAWERDTGNVGLWEVSDAEPLLAALRSAQSR